MPIECNIFVLVDESGDFGVSSTATGAIDNYKEAINDDVPADVELVEIVLIFDEISHTVVTAELPKKPAKTVDVTIKRGHHDDAVKAAAEGS